MQHEYLDSIPHHVLWAVAARLLGIDACWVWFLTCLLATDTPCLVFHAGLHASVV